MSDSKPVNPQAHTPGLLPCPACDALRAATAPAVLKPPYQDGATPDHERPIHIPPGEGDAFVFILGSISSVANRLEDRAAARDLLGIHREITDLRAIAKFMAATLNKIDDAKRDEALT